MIGDLRKRITIQSVAQVTDGMGGFTETWSTHATRWGKIEPATGSEIWFANQRQARTTHTITIRYLGTVTAKMRVSYGGRIFHIHAVRNMEERNRVTVLTCEEGAAS